MTNRALEIELDFTNPYKQTSVFVKEGRAFFGLHSPLQVEVDGSESEFRVSQGLQGHLDLIADEVYGDRRLWRVIAHANKIDFPHEQVVAGMVLVIPYFDRVSAALLESKGRVRE